MWEERKKGERAVNKVSELQQKLTDSEERERKLQERLERREKLIGQLEKGQSERLMESERLRSLMKEWRQTKEEFAKRELELRSEAQRWSAGFKEVNSRVGALVKV
jgi:predicted nuclease with TOPRIM domain